MKKYTPPSRRNTLGRNRIETFIGFCIKKGKLTLGSGAVDTLKNDVYLLIVSSNASENAFKLAVKFKNRLRCPLLICKTDFESVVNRVGCKIAAVRDRVLAKAILESLDNDYELYAGGND